MKYIIILFLFIPLFLSGEISYESDIIENILLGEHALLSNNIELAKEYFLSAYKLDSTSISIHTSLSDIYIMNEEYNIAKKYLYNAYLIDTTNINIGLKTSDICISLGNYSTAKNILLSFRSVILTLVPPLIYKSPVPVSSM